MKKKEEKKANKKSLAEVSQGERKKSAKKSRAKKHVKMTTLSSRIINDKDFMSKVKESSDVLLNDINAAAKKIAPYIKGIVRDSDKDVSSYVERLCGDVPADYNAHRDIFDSFVGLVKMMILDDMKRLESLSPVSEDSTPCSNEEVIPDEHDDHTDSQTVDTDVETFYDRMVQHQVCETDNGLLSVGYASKDKLSDLLVSWGYGMFNDNFEIMYSDIIDKYTCYEDGNFKFNRKWFDLNAGDWSEYLKIYGDRMLPDIINCLADDNFGFKTKITKGLIHIFLRDEITDGSYVLALNSLSDQSFGSGALGFQVTYLRMILKLVVNWIFWHPEHMVFFVAHQHRIKQLIFDGGVIKCLEDMTNLSNFWGIAFVIATNVNDDPSVLAPYYRHMKCSERLINNVEFVSMMDEHERILIYYKDYFKAKIASVISKSSPLASGINNAHTMKVVRDALNVTEANIQALLLRYADIITEFITGNGYESKGWTSVIHDFIVGDIDVSEFTSNFVDVYDVCTHRDLRFKVNDIMSAIYLWFDTEFYGTSRVATYLENACEKEISKNSCL